MREERAAPKPSRSVPAIKPPSSITMIALSLAGLMHCTDGSDIAPMTSSNAASTSATTSQATASGQGGAGAGTGSNGGSGGEAAAGGEGGEGGAGGQDPDGFGIFPTTLTPAFADAVYQDWKTSFVEDCGDGSKRVRFDNPAQTVSEGIGYGMLLSAYHGDQSTFDGLWSYYKKNLDGQGLMHWRIEGCSHNASGQNAATDADLDAAMALLKASCTWGGNYKSEATNLIALIRQHETEEGCGTPDSVLRPGDVWGGCITTSPSYFAPAYYRVFALLTKDPFWDGLTKDTYLTLAGNAHPNTGLVSDWCTSDGTPGNKVWNAAFGGERYHYDAARTPWRFATDYAWWGDKDAEQWLKKVTAWVDSVGIANIGDSYLRDGTKMSSQHNSTFVGGFACGAIATDATTVDTMAKAFKDIPARNDQAYFQKTLRALYALLLTDQFARPTCL